MPALDLYTSPSIVQPRHIPQPSRPASPLDPDKESRARDVSPDPMNSLMEATRMNGLRSQLRSAKQRRKGGMRRRDHDLIAQNLLSETDAEEMLHLFKNSHNPHLFSAGIADDATIASLRSSSTVLFTAVMLVAAFHVEGRESMHDTVHGHFMGLVTSVMWDRFHTLDDIRGIAIAAFWQPYLSWKLSGLSIRMATELNLHHAFYAAFSEQGISDEERKEGLEKTRLWYLLYILDHQSSIAYTRPSSMSELRPIKDFELLLQSGSCTVDDRALIAQVAGLAALSRAFDHFGLNPRRVMTGDDAAILNHTRFADNIQSWYDRWSISEPTDVAHNASLQYHFSNLVLHSMVLRGRPLEKLCTLPSSLRPLALKAIESAHAVLQHFLDDAGFSLRVASVPLYVHSTIAFAVVFLLKLAHRWRDLGITIDPEHRTIPLIKGVTEHLRACKVGANHMVFSMAKGFERMLRQPERSSGPDEYHAAGVLTSPNNAQHSNWSREERRGPGQESGSSAAILSEMSSTNGTFTADHTHDDIVAPNWDLQDEELWSVAMGYDLLEPTLQGGLFTDCDFFSNNW
ncbi:hypothetical protein Slin15195_G123840 [Septoria linicola]|uniref:Xylanolytic transcriptional activator regulatory domain-containing protein n=1 Tax=Septoria linicola TaxID=215465 RepID=A0A9Q9B6D4_9PEZI|nr:hypothetical protein Slin14017_G080040 [Septoria linicola]USW59065.1 hypothetical protein Slin15195_G123840 [Septoria linicola]